MEGIRYEKRAKKLLEERWQVEINYHKWIRFQDHNGIGHAEPEAFVILKDRIILFEVKLTGGQSGRVQMEKLYVPLLQHIFKRPVFCLMICRNVVPETPGPRFNTPEDFLTSGKTFGVWQWIG